MSDMHPAEFIVLLIGAFIAGALIIALVYEWRNLNDALDSYLKTSREARDV